MTTKTIKLSVGDADFLLRELALQIVDYADADCPEHADRLDRIARQIEAAEGEG